MRKLITLIALITVTISSKGQISPIVVDGITVRLYPVYDEKRENVLDTTIMTFSVGADTLNADSLFLLFGTEKDKGDVLILGAKVVRLADGTFLRFKGFPDFAIKDFHYDGRFTFSNDIFRPTNFITALLKDNKGLFTTPQYYHLKKVNSIGKKSLSNVNILFNRGQEELRVDFESDDEADVITLYNLQGKIVKTATVSGNGLNKKATIDTKGLANGNYILSIAVGSTITKRTISLY